MAVSSIEWNIPARRPVSPGAVPSRTAAAFTLDASAPDPRPRVSEARARDDRAAAADRAERIASERAADAAANREAAEARDTAKAAAAARAGKAEETRPPAPPRPRTIAAQTPSDPDAPRPAAANPTPAARADTKVPPGAPATPDLAAPARGGASAPKTPTDETPTGETLTGETAKAETAEDKEPAAQAGAAAPIVPLPIAPSPTATALAAQTAASNGSGEAVPAEDPAGSAAPVVAAGPDAEGAAGPVPQGLTIHAPAGRGEGGEPGSGKPQGDFAAGLAPALEGAARTDLAPAATAAPAPSHVRPTEAAAPNLPAAPAQPPVPLGAVPMTIGLRSLSGSNQFEIRLDPKDLGRIDVNLDIDKETGAVQARLVVDRPETLALLQRDAGNLQQALAQAGLNPGEGSIDLSLRGDGQSDGRSNGSGGDGQRSETGRSARADGPDPNPIAAVPMRRYGALSGIDIRI